MPLMVIGHKGNDLFGILDLIELLWSRLFLNDVLSWIMILMILFVTHGWIMNDDDDPETDDESCELCGK